MLPPEITDDGFGEKITTFSLSKKIPVFIRIGLALPLMPMRTAPLPACNAQSSERQVTTATATTTATNSTDLALKILSITAAMAKEYETCRTMPACLVELGCLNSFAIGFER